jgi:hypothetical protein
MLILNKYFYKSNKSKLCIGDRVTVLNNMFYEYGGSSYLFKLRELYSNKVTISSVQLTTCE